MNKSQIYDIDESLRKQNAILFTIKNKIGTSDVSGNVAILINSLPKELLEILRMEIISGNIVTTISGTAWPHLDSIVVNFKYRFKTAQKIKIQNVEFIILNDINYWREQIKQTVQETDYLLIT